MWDRQSGQVGGVNDAREEGDVGAIVCLFVVPGDGRRGGRWLGAAPARARWIACLPVRLGGRGALRGREGMVVGMGLGFGSCLFLLQGRRC